MSPSEAAPRLIIARHGETEYNRRLLCQGWLDIPLNETGKAQARRLADRLGGDPVSRVVASPLERARSTAQAVADRHGLEVETHEGLKEIYHGELEGLPFLELDKHVPGIRDSWRHRPDTVQMPGGECLADVQKRAWPVFEEVTRQHVLAMRDGGPYGRMVLVAHAVAIGALMCKLQREPLSRMPDYRLGPCGFFELEHTGGTWNVVDAVELMGHTRV
jgi:phosphoserine phosphatase